MLNCNQRYDFGREKRRQVITKHKKKNIDENCKPVSEQQGQSAKLNESGEILRGMKGAQRVQSNFGNVSTFSFGSLQVNLHFLN